jgi:chromate transporter
MSPSSNNTEMNAPTSVSLYEATRFWLKLGFISFGGPAGQIAIMHQELVERRRWISEKRFLHALNYCMVLPGPEAQQLATYMGWLLHKTWGGIIAGVFFVLPSLFILIGLSWVYIAYGDQTWVSGLFYGIKPVVTAVVVHAAHKIGSRTLTNKALWALATAAFIAIFILKIPFPIIVVVAGSVGYFGGRFAPDYFNSTGGHGVSLSSYGPALIDDDTPTPDHAKMNKLKTIKILIIGFILWVLPMGLLITILSWNGTFTQMAWFFTKAALLTIGGAYAVLPYVYQGAVVHYAWLSPTQMIDGLALGETTPGPLIMVVAFVAFVGGYGKALLGPDMLFISGAVAAALVTWFTFLPSFLFILVGGPLVESTHGELKFTAPLTAITAAVVGVILNLALFFIYHVLWPNGFGGGLDWLSVIIAIFATVALFHFKTNVIHVIIAGAIIGLIAKILMVNTVI